MLKISYFKPSEVPDTQFRYAVIVSRYQDKWLFVRQSAKNTYEMPAGRREPFEPIEDTAKRELWEETGATDYQLSIVGAFYVGDGVVESAKALKADMPVGLLCFAEVKQLGSLPDYSEITEVQNLDNFPEPLSYPEVQPYLLEKVKIWLKNK